MNSRLQTLFWPSIWEYFLIGAVVFSNPVWADVTGGIATDGTMGPSRILSGASVTIPQSLGTTAGNNLFHSFTEFNIANSQTVEFTGSHALQNVISRVTGTDVTEIGGTLRSSIANAAFYFINPNGITFGAGAQVDVPGAFHAGTADKIDFAGNSGVLYADSNQASTLSTEAPAAFGFLGTSTANNGLIEVNNTHLTVGPGQTLDMVAGKISVENRALVAAPGGEVRLVAMKGAGSVSLERSPDGTLPLPVAVPTAVNGGDIVVNASAIDGTGEGGGRIALWGGDTSFTNSTGYNDNSGATDATSAKGVDIRANSLRVDNSWISFDALAAGKAGNVRLEATETMAIDKNGHIKSSAFGLGNAGNVMLNAKTLDIFNGGNVSSSTYAQGNAGTVTVTAATLKIDSQGYEKAATGIVSRANPGSSGQAGDVLVRAGTLEVVNGGRISSSTFTHGNAGNVEVTADTLMIDSQGYSAGATSIFSKAEAGSNGQAGNVTVQAGELDIVNAGDISSSTDAQGNAGNVTIRAAILNILNGGVVSSFTSGQGNAGNVEIAADSLTLNSQGNSATATGIYSRANQDSSGHAGNVAVHAGSFDIVNGGNVSSSTFAEGDAGDVNVSAETLTIDGQGNGSRATGINSQANQGRGNAGNVAIQAGTLNIVNGGVVSSSTFAEGNAGNITVTANALKIDSQSNSATATGIVSRANQGSGGHAGNVDVQAGAFDIVNGGTVSSSTFAEGHAGNVTVKADSLKIDGLGNFATATGIFSEAKQGSGGHVGNITVQAANAIKLANGGKISIENAGNVIDPAMVMPGVITVSAADIDIKESSITTNSTGNVSAGNVKVSFSHWLTMDPSFIRTTANTGNGGTITIGGGELIFLQNSGFITTVKGADSNGGDISVSAGTLLMDNGIIQANAVGGSGGDIALNLNALIPSSNMLILGGVPVDWQAFMSGLNVIQAASQAGVSGTVSVTAPQLNLSGIVANLGGPQFDTNILSQDYCGLGTGSSLTRKGAGGLKPKSGDQLPF